MTKRLFTALGWVLACATVGCMEDGGVAGASDGGKEAGVVVEEQGVDTLEIDFTESVAQGTFQNADQQLTFRTEVLEGVVETTIELRGLVLLLTIDTAEGGIEVDGYAADNGQDTQMLEDDVALLGLFEKRFEATFEEHHESSSAIEYLNRSLTLWSDYNATTPLKHTYHGRFEQSSSRCGWVNKPGQGVNVKKWTRATHDCNVCHWWYGCNNGDDRSTTDNVFLSMHADGSCADDTYFGDTENSFSCHEPDHSYGQEYAYGACFGRCGGSCGSGTQFTDACINHDQCVRGGHSIASFWCADELSATGWDVAFAPNCGGKITVDYNWAGSSNEGNCPTSWKDTNDGCDHGCQFIDGDCFR